MSEIITTAFDVVKKIAAMFGGCNIHVEPFFFAVAKYIHSNKIEGIVIQKEEIIALCCYILKNLAYALLIRFQEIDGCSMSELEPYVKSNLSQFDTGGNDYFIDETTLALLKNVHLYAKAQLNGQNVEEMYAEMAISGLLPES